MYTSQKLLFFIFFFISPFCQAQDTIVLITGKVIPVMSVDFHDYAIDYRTIDGRKLKSIDAGRVFSVKYPNGAERVIFRSDSLDAADFSEDEMRRFIKGEQDARDFYRNRTAKFVGYAVGGGATMFGFFGLPIPLLFSTGIGGFSPDVKKNLSFKIGGNAISAAGFDSTNIVNSIVGRKINPVFEKDSKFIIAGKTITFPETVALDTAVSMINKNFRAHRVIASNENNKLKLYRSTDTRNIEDQVYREGFEKRSRDYKIRTSLIGGIAGYISGIFLFTLIYHNSK